MVSCHPPNFLAESHARSEETVAKDAQDKAVAATNKLKAVEDELRAVEDEARAIAAEIKAQEDAKANEIARLDALTQDQSVGIVKRNMAVQQLAQLKNEDSLPLQKAKLTQEAVVRKLAKVTQAAVCYFNPNNIILLSSSCDSSRFVPRI